ncbi:MAG TPA: hypothetical protein VGQ81_12560 [Acidobacteriota bacterium]|nr:hypothetical protein [Acidobacteriota bacterium]
MRNVLEFGVLSNSEFRMRNKECYPDLSANSSTTVSFRIRHSAFRIREAFRIRNSAFRIPNNPKSAIRNPQSVIGNIRLLPFLRLDLRL